MREKRVRKMVNRRFSAVFAFVVALAAQTYSKCIGADELLDIIDMFQTNTPRMPENKLIVGRNPMELPAGMIENMDKNLVRDNTDVRMRSMPPDEEMDEFKDVPLTDAIMRSDPLEDPTEPRIPPIDRIDPHSIPIVDMDQDTVYKWFGFRRPDMIMRSIPLDANQLTNYQIRWRPTVPRELLM